jgi:ABC-type bacteriocin/lantibiotic exporter with double-glycine peptidase domain
MNDHEIMEILERVNAAEFIRQKNLTLDSTVENFRFMFSGGELQRLALARSFIRKPYLLILDEATSALDEKNEDTILRLLQEIKKSVTIIFVTHKKRLIQSFDDFITLHEPDSE